jgi:hypothetical protein
MQPRDLGDDRQAETSAGAAAPRPFQKRSKTCSRSAIGIHFSSSMTDKSMGFDLWLIGGSM